MSECRCHRASTEREPTTLDLVFAAVFLAVVLSCFVGLWYGISVEFAHRMFQVIGRAYPAF